MDQPRILIVDDEERIRSLVASYLKSDGFEVVESENGREAVAEVGRRRPELRRESRGAIVIELIRV